MPVSIRPARADDAAAIAAIYAAHVLTGTATFDTVPRTLDEMAAKIAECQSRGWPFLVAEDGGQPVGYAYAAKLRDRHRCAPTHTPRARQSPCKQAKPCQP